MARYAEQMQGAWADGQTLNIASEMMRLTLQIVGKTLFDTDVLGKAEEVGDALTTAMHGFNAEVNALVHIPRTWPTPANRRNREAARRLDAIIYRIIAERRRSGEDRGDLLSMLLHAQDEDDGSFMTDTQVRDEAMTLFLAGHETTANALAWSWHLLAQHPDVYARVREEADGVLGGRTPTFADLPELAYTLQVFKETMRLYPPAHTIGRQATRPVELGGYELAAGSVVLISPYVMHRRPDYFPDPERFDPERFTPEAEERLPRFAYMPFGGGPRICIGNHFALMEGHLLLAALAQRVTFELVPRQRIEPEPLITLRPKRAISMVVRRRAE
jgi:cytochrome P450